MNNRIISILLTISLILCFSSIIVDAKDSADYSKALKLLTGLSIGTLTDENAEISRGEFSQCISDILNYSSRPVNKNGNFKDVTLKDENSGAVYDLFARKIVSGYSTETFGLKNPISYEQAVKILVTTLGYNIVAEQRGGYPSGYMIIAHELRLLNNIKLKNGDKLSQGEAAQLIANALNAQVQVQTIFGDREHFETYEGTTLLLEAAGIQKIVGVVTDNGTTALTGKSNIGEKQLKIDSIVCDITDTEGQEYLGYKVEAYLYVT